MNPWADKKFLLLTVSLVVLLRVGHTEQPNSQALSMIHNELVRLIENNLKAAQLALTNRA